MATQFPGKIPGEKTGISVKKSICSICNPRSHCGIDVYLKDGKIIKVEGTKEHPANEGTLCAKGAATRQYVYHEDRIKTPLMRTGPKGSGNFVPVSWDQALDFMAERLNQLKEKHGPESIVFYAGYPKWMRPFLHRLAHAFGSPNYCSESSLCQTAVEMSWKLLYGASGQPDIRNARLMLVWTTNPFYSNSTVSRRILNAISKGLKIICIDPKYSPMAAQANLHLQLKPGTDGALALSIAHVLINEGLYDQDFVENHSHGFAEYKEYAKNFPPEIGEKITGVPKEKIREAALMLGSIKPACLLPGPSPVVHNTNGVQNCRALLALLGLTGNFDAKGGNLVQPKSYLYVSAGFRAKERDFYMPRPWESMPPRIGQEKFPVWCDLVDEAQAVHLPLQIASGRPYPLKAMVGFGMNHRMWPDSDFMAQGLSQLDFVVNVDLFMTDTARMADLVLPACTSLERSEFKCYGDKYAIYTQPAIEPLFESRSDVDIIYDLAHRLKLDDPLFQAGVEASLDWILEPSGLNIAELKKHPAGMPVPNPLDVLEKKYKSEGFPTPSGKMEFVSTLLEKYQNSHHYTGLPTYAPPKYSKETTPELAERYPFILNTGSRLPIFIHSETFRLPWIKGLRSKPLLEMNPSDAASLGIRQDDPVKLSTPKGTINVYAHLTEVIQPGMVQLYHDCRAADVNTLFEADYVDPISGFPGFKSYLCAVERTNNSKDGEIQCN